MTDHPKTAGLKDTPGRRARSSAEITVTSSREEKGDEVSRGTEIGAWTLLEDSPVCTKIIDLDARLVFMSHAGIARLGIPDVNVLYGQSYPADLYPEWIRRPMVEHLNRALKGEACSVECPLLDVDGNEVWFHTTFLPVRSDAGDIQYILATSVDITKRIEAEESLRRMQKLDSIGVLAGGIAHDFNNLLTGLTGNLSLAQREKNLTGELRDLLEDCLEACDSARGLTTQLLTFAVGGEPVMETVLLEPIVTGACKFNLRGSNVKCVYEFDDDLYPVLVDKSQLSQVLHNLVINASQAMPEGGVITVEAVKVELGRDDVPALPSGNYVRLRVQDEGVGIQPEHLEKIFDPYFSTKESGRGLGLATSHSIIVKHGGFIEAESEPGKGSAFVIYLPAGRREDVKREGEVAERTSKGGRLLIMDDDAIVIKVVGRLAGSLGYECTCVSDGAMAIQAYAEAVEQGAPFDAVIMDFIVPCGMGGKEANAKLKQQFPEAKSIVSSGYSTDAVIAHYADFGFDGTLSKPYTRANLADVLDEVIGGVSQICRQKRATE